MDDKGRIKVPASLAKQMEDFGGRGFCGLKRSVFQKCLEVYPIKHWDRLMEKINGLNRFPKEKCRFYTGLYRWVKTIELDNAGRIQISKDLIQYALLEKEIVITSAGELFEVWDKDSYETVITDSEDSFAQLAEEVMKENEG
ncbi:division/cell wall cluster transcriptional repressor MraZ [Bergeyella porcorum]|uniref:Transcriptional regulator MraZ n=1 Tax=Bergeyella porcorum TaxID=1735111 RepID=A0AAU0F2M1_9FLAO